MKTNINLTILVIKNIHWLLGWIRFLQQIRYACEIRNKIDINFQKQQNSFVKAINYDRVTNDQKQYRLKKKIYNFNEILDGQQQQKYESIKSCKKNPSQDPSTEQRSQLNNQAEIKKIDQEGDFKMRKKGDLKPRYQRSAIYEYEKKQESYTLLKMLGATLAVLVAMTIFQHLYPNSQYNLLRVFKTSINTNNSSQASNFQTQI